MSVEITDEMIARAQCELRRSRWNDQWSSGGAMRAALDAALNPPPLPEVTPEMQAAGARALKTNQPHVAGPSWYLMKAAEVYRAMRALEPIKPQRVTRRCEPVNGHACTVEMDCERRGPEDRRTGTCERGFKMNPKPWDIRGDHGRNCNTYTRGGRRSGDDK